MTGDTVLIKALDIYRRFLRLTMLFVDATCTLTYVPVRLGARKLLYI
jgi:hypothetical protein